ncbi:MAG TPA: LPXTG cell wall anchor domain-containing protein [Acidimicrobiia bacterium]|nr:LPXTG cell wall anchor domain-containing protein [Acidimicrobiia bacterium]
MKTLQTAPGVRGTKARLRGRAGVTTLGGSEGRVAARRLIAVALIAGVLVFAFSQFAYAQTTGFSVVIPLDTVVYIPWDSNRVLATEPVPEEFAGMSCGVSGISRNQDSVHPDNDLIIGSGASEVILENVEDEPGETLHAAGTLVLGAEVTVTLHMGPDAIFSAGIDVVIDCSQVTSTTIETTTTSTTLSTTTTGPTSTSVPGETTTTIEDEVLGTVITSPTVGDEVGDADELPFTGPHDGAWLLVGGSLVAVGGILVVGARRRQED